MARTPLAHFLQQALRGDKISRRDLLRAAPLPALMPFATPGLAAAGPRVVIVGAGVAGLYAAWLLKRNGLRANVYEASGRTGGRMYSAQGALGPGLVTELGGEFIDTIHPEILGLAKHFQLPLIDTQSPDELRLRSEAFLFGGKLWDEAEVIAEFRKLAPQLKQDIAASGTKAAEARFDRLSLDDYLISLGAKGRMLALLQVAFLTEFGMETSEQSAMNFLSLVSAELNENHVALLGTSDERYKILGGNQRIPDSLAQDISDQVVLDHRLESVSQDNSSFRLSFVNGGVSKQVGADILLVAIPFSILRSVRMDLRLPEGKRRAIQEIGYGTNAKLMMGVSQRVWRSAGFGGNLFSDEPFQMAWDSSRGQSGTAGSLTMLCGGKTGSKLAHETTQSQAQAWTPLIERAFPGFGAARNEKMASFLWPSHPHTLGSYSSFRMGQWSSLRKHVFPPVGRLHFAGEHTSQDFQGYMEGGAETGKRAALAILRQTGIKANF